MKSPTKYFLPYQIRWLDDDAPLKKSYYSSEKLANGEVGQADGDGEDSHSGGPDGHRNYAGDGDYESKKTKDEEDNVCWAAMQAVGGVVHAGFVV